MKRKTAAILIALFLFISRQGAFCEDVFIKQWAPFSGIAGLTADYNGLKFTAADNSPFLISSNDLFINANARRFLRIRLKTEKSYMTGRILFKRIGDPDFSLYNSVDLQEGLGGMTHDYVIDMSANPNWYGMVTQLIFSPGNETGSIEMAAFELPEPGAWLSASAKWQEFMAFEPIKGYTVNTIKGKTIGRTPVNRYIYILLIICIVVILIKNFREYKFNGLSAFWRSCGHSFNEIVIISVILFAALECRQAVDNLRQFDIDRSTLAGKTIDEKRELTSYNGIYGYTLFVKERLPENATVTFSNPDLYTMLKAAYYLYPIKIVQKDADYILVFKAAPSGTADYKVFAMMSNDQMILVKKGGSGNGR